MLPSASIPTPAAQVELLSWRSIKDISGDGGIIKTVLAEGSGWEHCQRCE